MMEDRRGNIEVKLIDGVLKVSSGHRIGEVECWMAEERWLRFLCRWWC